MRTAGLAQAGRHLGVTTHGTRTSPNTADICVGCVVSIDGCTLHCRPILYMIMWYIIYDMI